jgi:alpha-1,2-mannosyltransferase
LALARAALPVTATVVFAAVTAAILATAGATWGYDYQAYALGARRLLDGLPLYDPGVDLAGAFGIFYYPPPFAVAVVPFELLGDPLGLYAWTALLIGSMVAAIALMPVPASLRWTILLLAGLNWPVMYALKLGQVTPILLLVFVLGWRSLDRASRLGVAIGIGTLIKIQPGLIGVWAILTGRWRAALVGFAVVAAACLATLPLIGVGSWQEYLALLRRVSSPVETPHNFTPGAVLFQAGLDAGLAGAIQLVVMVATLGLVIIAARRLPTSAGYVVAVVATQLISPLLWDHYAVILLLPVAWLAARGAWWALAIPVVTSLPLIWLAQPLVYPLLFGIALVAPFAVRQR